MLLKEFENFDPRKAPPVIEVEFSTFRTTYLVQWDGYHGVPVNRNSGKRSRFGHTITLTPGPNFCRVSPPATTVLLARAYTAKQATHCESENYYHVIQRVLRAAAVVYKAWTPGDDADLHNTCRLPHWLRLEAGTGDNSEARACGVEQYILEFSDVVEMHLCIKAKKLLETLVDTRYIKVHSGRWTPEADRIVKENRVSSGIIQTAKDSNLTLRRNQRVEKSEKVPHIYVDRKTQ